MAKKKKFQIKSKEDALSLAAEIKQYRRGFHYYLPMMGHAGGMRTIQWYPDTEKYTSCTSAAGGQNENEISIGDIVDYLWEERKLINAELRYIEATP